MGDSACFLKYACFDCGLMLEAADRARAICPRCGAEVDVDEVDILAQPTP